MSADSADSATAVHVAASEFSLQRIASTMEIIDPRDITLVKFLGSGGYGEVHLGKWHSSEAAIKCLNPSLFFQVCLSTVHQCWYPSYMLEFISNCWLYILTILSLTAPGDLGH